MTSGQTEDSLTISSIKAKNRGPLVHRNNLNYIFLKNSLKV